MKKNEPQVELDSTRGSSDIGAGQLLVELGVAVTDEDIVAVLLGFLYPVASIEPAAEHNDANPLDPTILELYQEVHRTPPFA